MFPWSIGMKPVMDARTCRTVARSRRVGAWIIAALLGRRPKPPRALGGGTAAGWSDRDVRSDRPWPGTGRTIAAMRCGILADGAAEVEPIRLPLPGFCTFAR